MFRTVRPWFIKFVMKVILSLTGYTKFLVGIGQFVCLYVNSKSNSFYRDIFRTVRSRDWKFGIWITCTVKGSPRKFVGGEQVCLPVRSLQNYFLLSRYLKRGSIWIIEVWYVGYTCAELKTRYFLCESVRLCPNSVDSKWN